eukprot:TRINITY_DN2050_c0_g1_i3.p1 TRINITY_DN2050_c0_g1~~TRINITY_DN2050_c0_g1_i3.p1  ORF type:complete len:355 (+),score=48.18 TRINITY_DN2050_c0_g1_i3:146-1210(+)
MQKAARPYYRPALQDVTNSLLYSKSGSSIATKNLTAFPDSSCPHYERLPSVAGKTSNCIHCGSFISHNGTYGLTSNKKMMQPLVVSPSLMFSSMIEEQEASYEELSAEALKLRNETTEWLCETGESLQVSSEAIHKAVALFEKVFSQLLQEDHKKTSLLCLFLAAKLIESDKTVHHIKALLKTRFNITSSFLRQHEVKLLTLLSWNLQCVTVLDFIQLFEAQGIVFNSDKVNASNTEKPVTQRIAESVKKYAEFFAEMCLQRPGLAKFNKLQVACGCVAAARKQMQLALVWSEELEAMTGVKHRGIETCIKNIEGHYENMFLKSEQQTKLPAANSNYSSNRGVSVYIGPARLMK